MNQEETYFKSVLIITLLAICTFIGLKTILPERLFPDNQTQSENIVIDSLALMAIEESKKNDTIPNDSIISTPNIDINYLATDNMEGHSFLINFFDKLYQLEKDGKKKIRIAYFSDSMTDGDLIVQDIRKQFQGKYGGKGVGFVSITSLSATSRYSVTHRFSKNWNTKSFLKNHNSSIIFGIDGQVSFISDSIAPSVEYQANDLKDCELLYQPTLFFGKSDNNNAYITLSSGDDKYPPQKLTPKSILNTLPLSSHNLKKLKIEFHNSDSIPFYGVNFDNNEGIHIDNFSMRGNSGLPLSTLSHNILSAFNNELHYDLIIMHYGANVLGYKTADYSWYEKKMAIVTNHMKKCFPNADVLIISIADKSSKQDMEMKTDSAVVPLILAQKRYATNTKSGFINLYNLMGGENSMVKWVEETSPPLANKDYTHFNANGSKKVASLIFNELENSYSRYKKIKEMGSIK